MRLFTHRTAVAAMPPVPPDEPGATTGWFNQPDPAANTPPSVLTPEIMNAVMAEFKNAIEGANLTLDKNDNGQLLESIRRLGGQRPRAQFWRSLASATSLSLATDYRNANAPGPGVILVDTTTSSGTVILPSINSNYRADRAAQFPLTYKIVKFAAANIVTITANAGDDIIGVAANSITLDIEGDWVEIVAVSLSSNNGCWLVNAAGAALPRKLADAAYNRAIADAYTAAVAADRKSLLPPGSIVFTACANAPTGWLKCDDGFIGPTGTTWPWAQNNYGIGNAHTGSDYAALFAALSDQGLNAVFGTTGNENFIGNSNSSYSSKPSGTAADWWANGSYVMPLPRLRGRTLAAAGNGRGLSSRSPGVLLGEETHSLSIQEMPYHSHNNRLKARANQNNAWVEYANGSSMRTSNSQNQAVSSNNIVLEATPYPNFDGIHYFGEWKQIEDNIGSNWSYTKFQPTSFLNAIIKL
ncbi:MAG: hypothetical protein QM537_01475 [Candidatus Symbiobacter sp.]|nr:hypothetical protein [Candidatus Symbiobacter sp.]